MGVELAEHFNLASHFLDAPAALHAERTAIVGDPREVTYGELAALANRAGNALLSQGVSRGDRVLLALPDSAEFVATFFGAAKIGVAEQHTNGQESRQFSFSRIQAAKVEAGKVAGIERAPKYARVD